MQLASPIALAAPFFVLALAASCAGASPERADLADAQVGGIDLFDQRRYFVRQAELRAEAEQVVWQCMKDQGFDYEMGSMYSVEENDPMASDLIDGISDEEFAQRWGFGVGNYEGRGDVLEGPDEASTSGEEAGPDRSDPEVAAYYSALDGTSARDPGCSWPAYEELRSLDDEYFEMVDEIEALRAAFATEDVVIEYYRDWSQCMDVRGYSYTSPLEAELHYLGLLSSGDPSPFTEERDAARATVACGGAVIDLLPLGLREEWSDFIEGRI